MKGRVKWFSTEKGYGFVTSESGEDHYFRVQHVVGADLPTNGDTVDFDPANGNKGPIASNVRIVSRSEPAHVRKRDDRIDCPGCGKTIVPRIITDHGVAVRSVCPFCGGEVEDFTWLGKFFRWFFGQIARRPWLLIPIGGFLLWVFGDLGLI